MLVDFLFKNICVEQKNHVIYKKQLLFYLFSNSVTIFKQTSRKPNPDAKNFSKISFVLQAMNDSERLNIFKGMNEK